jgi:hypothetical protein
LRPDWHGIDATDLMPHGRQVIQCSRRKDVPGAAQTKLPFASPSPNSEAPVLSYGYSVVRTARHLNYADQDVMEERLWCILGLRSSMSQPTKFSPSPAQAGSTTSGSDKFAACVAPSESTPYSACQNTGMPAFEACIFQRGVQLVVKNSHSIEMWSTHHQLQALGCMRGCSPNFAECLPKKLGAHDLSHFYTFLVL